MRVVAESALALHPELVGRTLARPGRRIAAFACDVLLLLVPSIVIAWSAAAIALSYRDPVAFQAAGESLGLFESEPGQTLPAAARIAPLLVRLNAPGLPAEAELAVRNHDLALAGEVLRDRRLLFALGGAREAQRPDEVRINVVDLVPGWLRGASLFGLAAVYFTSLTAGRRRATLGKRLMGIEVRKLDGRALTWWDSFERFGGYFASFGTFGLGLLDLWREPNRRLTHDRASNTIVVRR
jgi:hypothetical protein